MSKAKSSSKPKTKPWTLSAKPGETESDAIARKALRPSLGGAVTHKHFSAKYGDDLELRALVSALSAQAEAAQRGDLRRAESMLIVQAHTLDAIFNELAQRAARNMGEYLGACETYLRLALKAQSQCRATLETLATIKNPQPVAFVRQANIAAGPQQVNNGAVPERVRADAHAGARESSNPPNEQSRLSHEEGQRMDGRAPTPTGGAHPALEAVATVHRTDDTRG